MSGAAAGAAVAAQIINAIRAIGVIVKVEPHDFLGIVERVSEPLVVYSPPRLFSPKHEYLVSYKGLAFYTKSREELRLPGKAEIVRARSLYIPG